MNTHQTGYRNSILSGVAVLGGVPAELDFVETFSFKPVTEASFKPTL
jgi:hypothetical protein